MDHETALVNAFVLRERRARVIELLRNPRRRIKVLNRLYHFRDLDPRFLVSVPPARQRADAIAALLAERGAPAECHLISTNRELDGQNLPLGVALAQIVGVGDGTLVSCVPGRLGYFEGEDERFILARAAA